MQLTNDDRCAVDLLLEKNQDSASCYSQASSSSLQQRLARVETLLHRLDALPASEPPADLISRTLQRCQRAIDHRQPVEHAVHATSR